MSFDWTHEFCLACDKQTDGATYCSESCRLADYEKTSSLPSSGASSPTMGSPDWSFTKTPSTVSRFYLSPALDFSRTRSLNTRRADETSLSPSVSILTPSTSHTSLSSMRSNSSAGAEAAQLSEKATQELRAYARSFESVRLQRRRSY